MYFALFLIAGRGDHEMRGSMIAGRNDHELRGSMSINKTRPTNSVLHFYFSSRDHARIPVSSFSF